MNLWVILAGVVLLAALTKKAPGVVEIMPSPSPMDKRKAFVLKLWSYADALARVHGWKRDLIITQAAHESAWGTSSLAAKYNNLFGFTEGGWKKAGRPTVDLPTTEWIGGKATKLTRAFRTYGSWGESLEDWARLLMAYPRYAPAVKAMEAGDPQGFFDAMQKSGYATDPGYGQKLAGVYAAVERATV